jgi:DNA-binding GntR family transcriptional regulator
MNAEEQAIVDVVADFVDREVRPVARELEHTNTYPDELIEGMKRLGVFGLAIPHPYGDVAVSTPCYVGVTEQLARGWMSLAGAMGGHTVVAKLLLTFGTDDQKQRYLPKMATGEIRATMALTEPGGGSDLQALTTRAKRDGDGYRVNGAKTWITNARRSQLIALLCRTNPDAQPAHAGISILLVEPGPGFTVSRDLPKLGYKGVESCELSFVDYYAPGDALLGGVEGRGFAQMMRGLEIGRIQVAARAGGVRRRAALRPGAREFRQAHLAAPVDRQLSCRHGDEVHGSAPTRAARRAALRHRRAQRPGSRHGEAVRVRDRDGDRAERGARARRLRLLDRVRRRTVFPGRAADDRRRGHQRDPAQRDRVAAGGTRRAGPVTEAAYKVLARELRAALLQRRYADGSRLPTEAELAQDYQVSRQTVRRAFHDLVAEGMVYRVPGRGTFAAARDGQYLRQFGSIEDLMSQSSDTKLEILCPLRRQVNIEAAGRLRLTSDVVHCVEFRRLHRDQPFCHTTVYLHPDAGMAIADLPELATVGARSDATIIGLLDPRLPAPIAEAEQSITATTADEQLAAALDCTPGIPVLRIDRIYLTADSRPIELAISHFLPEQYTYRVKLRRST